MKYKILFSVLIAYLAIIITFLYFDNINNTEIVLSSSLSLKYEGKKWKSNDFKQKNDYNIYVDNNLIGKGLLLIDEGLAYYNNEQLDNFIAFSNDRTKVISYNEKEISKEEYQKVLKELDIVKYNNLSINKKIDIDYDNDNEIESIYILSNLFVDPFMEDYDDEKFSIAYTIDNDKKNIIYQKNFTSDMTGCLLNIKNILDINNDNKYELITTCKYFDQIGTKIQVYELKNKNYELVKEI